MDDNGEIKTIVTGGRDNAVTLVLALGLLTVFAGVVGGVGLGALAVITNAAKPWHFVIAGVGLGIVGAFVFAFYKLFYIIEAWLGIDINGDGKVGDPGQGQAEQPPQTEYLTPVWVEHENPKENPGHELHEIFTPKDDTLARMAVILAMRGPEFFTQDNFTTGKQGTKLMTREHWNNKFFPGLLRARLARYKNGSEGGPVELTDQGKAMFTKLAGRAGEQLPALSEASELAPTYALEIPHPKSASVEHSRARKWRG